MDLLKKELERKRKALQDDFGGKKILRRGEIEQKTIQKLREEEKKELEAKALRRNLSAAGETPDSPSSRPQSGLPNLNGNSSSSAAVAAAKPSGKKKEQSDEQKIDDLVLSKQEVIRRLRFFKQPITLFGEDDEVRLDRLKLLLKAGIIEVDNDMMEGQTNDFLRDIAELRKRQKTRLMHEKTSKENDAIEDGEGGDERDEDHSGEGGSSEVDADKDLKRMKANFEELCNEDKILVFFKRLLNEWKQELDERPLLEKRTAKGKSMGATFKQCARYLNPLFKFCRKRVLPGDIREALRVVVDCCIKRDYLAAMDQYIKMAIGNAPWPIGVTMVGIHERSAREKIYTNSVAHIMNDETTRKYLQSVKRLMTLCQRRYPTMPSKSVEFNSLANGSDLHALLSEEKSGAADQNPEERLRLMPASAES